MFLSVHVTSVLFSVRFNNFALTMGSLLELHALTLVARSYALLLVYTLHANLVMSTITTVLTMCACYRQWSWSICVHTHTLRDAMQDYRQV